MPAATGHTTGGLVEMDERGGVVRSASAADTTIADRFLYPYAVLPIEGLDRAISTTTDMDEGNKQAKSQWVQLWRLSNLELLRSIALQPGPRGDEQQYTGEPRLLPDGKSVYIHTFNCGLYRLGPGWFVRVRRDGGTLRVQATREGEVAMSARSDTTFWVEDYHAPMTFQVPASGPTQLAYRDMRVPKLEEPPPLTAAQLRDVVGEYESDELQVRYRIEMTDSGLVMRHPRHGTIALMPLRGDEFGGSTWFTRSVQLRRDDGGRVVGFSVYIDDRSRDIRFTRLR
jgi:hypothetical protein